MPFALTIAGSGKPAAVRSGASARSEKGYDHGLTATAHRTSSSPQL
ncbi:hypothetical protein [Streptomyces sp. NPDC017520]